ncbi:helix-turn-helix domain-containing protein [Piscinibacter gummiphilus]|uniref:Transcriptional regulator n=1 Tax=Piscinibacter gummiphilus TaxID=946333 RepID=A0A1W6L5N4_9BURK|nr:helix-turn-helix transcriptional regulator [Piscinibacter gummiphilus]ARN19641.1 transcriptional regulator [Piscinibacter gummiphilus]ATU64311.1 XRE family transcriptional regulator [Piscinibacter gummiphilus]GLS93513.1 hypothetical protein GCM10007918_08040 [Piscinibacter gummiphilus]
MRPSRNPVLLEALGSCLKDRRIELGITQEDVASAAGIDRPYITLIESARKQPTISVLWKLAAAVQFSPAEFAERIERRHRALKRRAREAPSEV